MAFGEGPTDEHKKVLRRKYTSTINKVKNLLKWSFSRRAFLDTNTAEFQ